MVGRVSIHEHTVLTIAFADERMLDQTTSFPVAFAAAVVDATARGVFAAAVTVTVVVGSG